MKKFSHMVRHINYFFLKKHIFRENSQIIISPTPSVTRFCWSPSEPFQFSPFGGCLKKNKKAMRKVVLVDSVYTDVNMQPLRSQKRSSDWEMPGVSRDKL